MIDGIPFTKPELSHIRKRLLMQQMAPRGGTYDMGQPVLAANAPMNMTQPGALSGNARGSVRMPQIPQNQRINMGGEGLMRIGGAGLRAA